MNPAGVVVVEGGGGRFGDLIEPVLVGPVENGELTGAERPGPDADAVVTEPAQDWSVGDHVLIHKVGDGLLCGESSREEQEAETGRKQERAHRRDLLRDRGRDRDDLHYRARAVPLKLPRRGNLHQQVVESPLVAPIDLNVTGQSPQGLVRSVRRENASCPSNLFRMATNLQLRTLSCGDALLPSTSMFVRSAPARSCG